MSSKSFDQIYQTLGAYIPPTKVPIVSAIQPGQMVVPVYSNMDYSNPNYSSVTNGTENSYVSVAAAYGRTCNPDGTCLSYKTISTPCNWPSVQGARSAAYSRI